MIAQMLDRAARPRITARTRPVSTGFVAFAPWATDTYGADWNLGGWVSDEDALGLPVVSAFLEILVGLVVQMPLHAWTGGLMAETDPPILRNPAPGPGRTLADWNTEVLRGLALRGNYLAVLGDNSWTGWPEVLYPIPWGQWSVEPDPVTAEAVYTIAGLTFPARDVFHVARNVEAGELVGRGLLDTHRQLLASAVAAEQWAARYYTTGAVPPAWIEHADPDLTPEQAAQLKSVWNRVVRLREAFITPKGTTVTALASDAEKAQLADTRAANDSKLAIACGIPGALLGLEGPSLTYRNITDVFAQFLVTTVMGYLEPIEQELSGFCLPRGTEARYQTSAVLRPDIEARLNMALAGVNGGLMTLDEGRAFIDLPPLPRDSNSASNTPAVPAPAAPPALQAVP